LPTKGKSEGRRAKEKGRRKKAKGRRQKAEGKRQKAEGRRQKAKGKRQKAEGQQPATGNRLLSFRTLSSFLFPFAFFLLPLKKAGRLFFAARRLNRLNLRDQAYSKPSHCRAEVSCAEKKVTFSVLM
jgi:hypothetical protein